MNGNRVLLDSNIIISATNNLIDISSILNQYSQYYISIVTYMEVLGFNFTKEHEEGKVKALLESFIILDVNHKIATEVISIRKKRKIKLPDAIIFASAKLWDCDLLTNNVNDFKNIDEYVSLVSF